MKTSFLRTKLLLGLGLSTALVAPLAIVVACGESAESTPPPTISAEEAAAQKSIIAAPETLASNATLSERVLFELKAAVKDLAGTTPLVEYLATNKPNFDDPVKALKYQTILMPELKLALGIKAGTQFELPEFTSLVSKLGLDTGKFATDVFQPAVKNYDGQKSDATASWAEQIKFWNFVFNPSNHYANLAKLLKTGGLITDEMLLNFDKVIATPLGEVSTVKDAQGNAIMGFGGQAIFNDLAPTPAQYQVRSESVIRRSITGEATTSPQIDLGQLNNIFEVYTAIAYALKIKDAAYQPIASFWSPTAWSQFADQLSKANYAANITFKLGSAFSPTPTGTADFTAANKANGDLIAALREASATPQVQLAAADWIAASDAANTFGEDALTDSGVAKIAGVGFSLTSNPIVMALLKANGDYATRVLGILATMSASQFSAYGELLKGLVSGLDAVFARLDSTIKQSALEAKFAPGNKINLWDITEFATKFTKEELRTANFFIKALTKQFDAPKYLAAPSA